MIWRDRVDNAVGSFRGVEFHVDRHSAERGRRVQVHEYPLRDRPYAEDIGRRAREFTLEAYLLGDDYDLQRDRLIDAVERPGAGELVHPYYGRRRVVVTAFRVRESTREGGIANVSLTVVEAEDIGRLPRAQADTRALVADRAEAARVAVLDDFVAEYDVLELATDRVAAVEQTLLQALGRVDGTVGGVSGPVSALIRSPADLGAQVLEAIARVGDGIDEPGRALGIYSDLYGAGTMETASATAPAAARQQAKAQTAAVTLVRRGAAVESAASAAGWDYDTRQDAVQALETVHAGLTRQLAADPAPLPAVARELSALRAAIVQDLRERGTALPELTDYTPAATLPALVIAQRLYGNARRAHEIVRRNGIRHPGAVPGGEALEVLGE
jgi:prophage DNA circulation protein